MSICEKTYDQWSEHVVGCEKVWNSYRSLLEKATKKTEKEMEG
jgi:hypothetical protein